MHTHGDSVQTAPSRQYATIFRDKRTNTVVVNANGRTTFLMRACTLLDPTRSYIEVRIIHDEEIRAEFTRAGDLATAICNAVDACFTLELLSDATRFHRAPLIRSSYLEANERYCAVSMGAVYYAETPIGAVEQALERLIRQKYLL